jgi:hypothetical protein
VAEASIKVAERKLAGLRVALDRTLGQWRFTR